MNRILELTPGEVIEVHLPAPEPDATADTTGFAGAHYGSRSPDTLPVGLPHLRIMVVTNPHPGLPIEGRAADDTGGYMMMQPPVKGKGGEGGNAAPVGWLFEWMANPTGTFLKFYFS